MSYTPTSLQQARDYLHARTGLSYAALGVVGNRSHTYGYHLGRDRLPAGDYSAQLARDRAGLSNAAAALDIGNFSRLRELTAFLLSEARAGRLSDVRALIGPTASGRAYRWDHTTGWRPELRARGDSHEWHLHISYYRDSEHRDKTGPFRQFFDETTPDEEDDMPTFQTGQLPDGYALDQHGTITHPERVVMLTVPPVRNGGLPWGPGFLSLGCDFGSAQVRVAIHHGTGWQIHTLTCHADQPREKTGLQLPENTGKISLARAAHDDYGESVPVSWLLEYGTR